jgi:formamidopyrimidine-DNA glycosylase
MEYGSERDLPGWDRLRLRLDGRRTLRINDPPTGRCRTRSDEAAPGADAFDLTIGELPRAGEQHGSVKAYSWISSAPPASATCWPTRSVARASIPPGLSRDLDADAIRRLHRTIRTVLRDLMERGGSHLGELQPERARDGVCPRDGAPLLRRTIGGRTTYSCPVHQR